MSSQRTFKFVFSAQLGKLQIKARISSPIVATWKRSNQSTTTSSVDLTNGIANFDQTIKLPVNMYFDQNKGCFLQKKSAFNFTMHTPKGDKTAGVVYVDLSEMLNKKQQTLEKTFILQKCPVSGSTIHMIITAQAIQQKSTDTMSVNDGNLGLNASILSMTTIKEAEDQNQVSSKQNENQKDERIRQLQQQVAKLQKDKKDLERQVTSLKSQLSSGGKSSNNISNYQLADLRSKLEGIYQTLQQNFQL